MPRIISQPKIERDPRARDRRNAQSCAQARYLAGNRLIRRLLALLLDQAPRAALVSLAIPGADGRDRETARSYYRVTNRATLGRRIESLSRRVPVVPDWRALSLSLRVGQGTVLRVADLLPGPPPDRLSPTRAAYVLACPATAPAGDPIGAVCIVFGIGQRAPRGAELRRLNGEAARIGNQIAAVLDLVGQNFAPSPYAEAA